MATQSVSFSITSIPQQTHECFMSEALKAAEDSEKHGNHPFGCVFVVDNKIRFIAENTVVTGKNNNKHAEMNLADKVSEGLAEKKITKEEVKSGCLYTSSEPCTMCSGGLRNIGVAKIVYACSAKTLHKIAHPGANEKELEESHMPACEEIFKGRKDMEVFGHVLEGAAIEQHERFWPNYRKIKV